MSGRGRVVSIDGRLLSPDEARVSVFDRGFLYGDSVFEVFRTYVGKPHALDEHLRRLRRSADRVFIPMPVGEDVLRREIDEALAAAGNDESYVRLMLTRGTGPLSLDPTTATRPLRVMLVEPVVPPPREAYDEGIALASVHVRRAVDDTQAAGAKVGNYLANLLALREARQKGAAEALVVDASGHVVEGASSNVFVVKSGRLATPPESAGILVGITREGILRAAAGLGIPVDERLVTLEELYAADEVFVTSSIREVLSVVNVDGHAVGAGAPGPIARALHRRFREDVGVRSMPWESPEEGSPS